MNESAFDAVEVEPGAPGPGPDVDADIDWGDAGDERFSIGDIVAKTGVPASSVHHYRRLGLIPEPERTAANQFGYDRRHIAALGLVRSLRQRGCSLDDIRRVVCERGPSCDIAALDEVGDRNPRARLIDAAIDAFGEQSFREVSITALCERAEVAKGTFYRYFEGKEELFQATARELIALAIDGFDAEAVDVAPDDHPAAFARHLRRGLPMLFELAKRVTQESGPDVGELAAMFAGLARRLGHVVTPDARDEQAEQSGGLLIMLALVKIFEELLEAEITRDER